MNLNSIGFLELQDILIKKGYRIDTLTQFKSVTRKGKPRYQMQVMPFLIFSAVMYVIHVQRLTVCRFVQLTGTVTHCQWVAADNFATQLSSVFIPATTCTYTKHLDRALGCDTSKACPCTLYAVIASL